MVALMVAFIQKESHYLTPFCLCYILMGRLVLSTIVWKFNLGLVLRLRDHREECADLYLKKHSTYILVEKRELLNTTEENTPLTDHHSPPDTPLAPPYVPLLQNCSTLLPKFQLRVAMETANPHRPPKSPRLASKAGHGQATNKSPSRKAKRNKDPKSKTPKDTR